MFKKQTVRKVGPTAPRRVHEGEHQVKYRLDGVGVWVREVSPGKAIVPSSVWYARVKGTDGVSRVVKLARDKTASETMLRDLRKHVDRVAAGLEAPKANTSESFEELVARYLVEKTDGGITEERRDVLASKLSRANRFFKWRNLEGIRRTATSDNMARWIAQTTGSSSTRLSQIVAVRGFLRWLNEKDLLPLMPRIKPVTARTEQPKRVLTDDELARLFATTPWKRSLFYRLALTTLTRRGALLKVKAADFNLEGLPTLSLRAEFAKTRKPQIVPVMSDLVPGIRALIAEMGEGVPLFSTSGLKNTTTAFRYDLKHAGITAKTVDGTATMHALRHTGATRLVRAGVSLLLIQRLGGWQNLRMLSEVYSHLQPDDARKSINAVFGDLIK